MTMTNLDDDEVDDAPAREQSAATRKRYLGFELTVRERSLLAGLAVLGVCAAVLWRPIQRHWLTWLVVRAEAPAQSLVDGLVESDPDPGALLNRLWGTEKIPHRLAVLDHLQTHITPGHTLQAEEVAILTAAAHGGDIEAKEKAFMLLTIHRYPELRHLAREQLRDADPAVRVLGLRYLARVDDSQLVPIVVPFLHDPDPRVATAAADALSRWTGNEFDSQASLPMGDFKREFDARASSTAVSNVVASWMDWWQKHQSDYATPEIDFQPSAPSWRLPVRSFSLADLRGREISLAALRGRTVLLTFWDMTATNSFSFLSDLSEVQRRNSDQLVIIGVSLDSTTSERDHDHEHEHEHAHSMDSSVQPRLIPVQLRQFVQDHGITYPILIDATGDVGCRFSAFELPTTIIIDRSGHMQRRFVGPRSGTVVEAMLADAEESLAKEDSSRP